MKNKRGMDSIYHTVIFILLELIIFSAMLYFVISQLNGSGVMEEKYAKEIALSLDYARPGMMITINMSDAMSYAEKTLGEKNLAKMVLIKGNEVTVRLSGNDPGYTYSFFNNVDVTNYYFDKTHGSWIFFIGGYK